MRTRTLVLLTLLLIPTALPSTSAILGPLEITLATPRVGDVARYAPEDPGETAFEVRTLIEGPGKVPDAYGIRRPVETYLSQAFVNGSPASAERCHAFAGSLEVVATELLSSGGPTVAANVPLVPLADGSMLRDEKLLLAFGETSCPGRVGPGKMREGTIYTLEELFGVSTRATPLGPARATSFENRGALEVGFRLVHTAALVSFDLEILWVFAHGLPGPALQTTRGSIEICTFQNEGMVRTCATTEDVVSRTRLIGFAPGAGPPLGEIVGAHLPRAPPVGRIAARPHGIIDDTGLDLAYPLAEALSALDFDPTVRYAEWRRSNPDAFLAAAVYDRRAKPDRLEDAETDGSWILLFQSSRDSYVAESVRVTGLHSAPTAPSPTKAVLNSEPGPMNLYRFWVFGQFQEFRPAPAIADGRALAAVAGGLGVAPGNIERLEYVSGGFQFNLFEFPATFAISDVSGRRAQESPRQEGLLIRIDAPSGAATSVSSTTVRPAPGGLVEIGWAPERNVLAPATVLGIPIIPEAPSIAAGLAGLALLALAAKLFLVPLYTRLARARLLDHPTRARIQALVKTDPGIHLSAIEARIGAADGTTRHHLAKLVDGGLLAEMRTGGFLRYYVAADLPGSEARRLAVLRSPTNARLHALLTENPTMSLREAGRRLGLSAPTVYRSMRKLKESGLLPPPSPPPPR